MGLTDFFPLLGFFEVLLIVALLIFDIFAIRLFIRSYMAVFIYLGTKRIDRICLPMSFNKNGKTEIQDLLFFWDHKYNRIWFRLKGWMYFIAPFVIGSWHLSSDRRTIIKEDIRLSYVLPAAFVIGLVSISVLTVGVASMPPNYKGLLLPVVVGIILVISNIIFMATRLKIASSLCLDSFSKESEDTI